MNQKMTQLSVIRQKYKNSLGEWKGILKDKLKIEFNTLVSHVNKNIWKLENFLRLKM